MTDIVRQAKSLLKEATPGPWEIYGGEIHQIQHTPAQCTSMRCDHRWPVLWENWGEGAAVGTTDNDMALMAAAPELAQALAEETYEYIAQVYCDGRWQFYIGESRLPTDKPGLAVGFSQKKKAQEFANADLYPARIVRRRVSPPEAIEDA